MASKLSLQQILQELYDESANALRVRIGVIATPAVQLEWDGATQSLDLSQSSVYVIDLSATAVTTLTFTNPVDGGRYTLILDTDSAAAITWPANVMWKGGSAPTLTTEGVDVVTFIYDETNDRFLADVGQAFAVPT